MDWTLGSLTHDAWDEICFLATYFTLYFLLFFLDLGFGLFNPLALYIPYGFSKHVVTACMAWPLGSWTLWVMSFILRDNVFTKKDGTTTKDLHIHWSKVSLPCARMISCFVFRYKSTLYLTCIQCFFVLFIKYLTGITKAQGFVKKACSYQNYHRHTIEIVTFKVLEQS